MDLRDPAVQRILHTDNAELSFNFRALGLKAGAAATQMLGERVAASGGIDGLIYESPANTGHKNLAIIERALGLLGSFLVVNDAGGALERRP